MDSSIYWIYGSNLQGLCLLRKTKKSLRYSSSCTTSNKRTLHWKRGINKFKWCFNFTLSLDAAFNLHRNGKRRRNKLFSAWSEQKQGSFTPVIATCKGILDREAKSYTNILAFHLSNIEGEGGGEIKAKTKIWVQARLQIIMLRSVSNSFRGSRTSWRGGNVEDSAGMPWMED